MSRVQARMVRVYLSESDHEMEPLLRCLHDELKVCGVTVTRGIADYGGSGVVHKASLVYLSINLSLVLEFFDLLRSGWSTPSSGLRISSRQDTRCPGRLPSRGAGNHVGSSLVAE